MYIKNFDFKNRTNYTTFFYRKISVKNIFASYNSNSNTSIDII